MSDLIYLRQIGNFMVTPEENIKQNSEYSKREGNKLVMTIE